MVPSLLNLLTYFLRKPSEPQRGSKRRPVGSNSRDKMVPEQVEQARDRSRLARGSNLTS